MKRIDHRLEEIEEEMRRTEVNKGTEAHLGMLKGEIAKLNQEKQEIAVMEEERKRKNKPQRQELVKNESLDLSEYKEAMNQLLK